MSKIGVVGMGWVGSSVAISTLHSGVASELVLSDIREGLAEGEAMDLAHGASFYPTAEVSAGAIEDLRGADAVVIAAGRGGTAEESRLDLLRDNARIVASIAEVFAGSDTAIIVLTNPVDVMTHVARQASGLPASRVLGTGTMLETARLRQLLGEDLDIAPRSIHAQVIGEHGDSCVPLWSSAQIGGVRLREWRGWDATHEEHLQHEVRRAAYEIIARKGATNHAIGLVTADLLRAIIRDERRVLTVSRAHDGTLGCDGVTLSLPAIVCAQGATEVLEPTLDDAEREALAKSAEILGDAIASL